MKALYPFLAVVALALVAYVGVGVAQLAVVFGVVLPYIAIALFVGGFLYRVIRWAQSPVPFRITTTAGQQKSLPWIKPSALDNPYNNWGVVGRMALEVLFFRSLFRNTKMEFRDKRLIYGGDQLLWAAGLVFHWSFLVIVLRHLRFFTEPVPFFVPVIQSVDGFFQIGLPVIYVTSVAIVVAVTYLFIRRVAIPQVRYISLPSDYFPLFLILGIALTGILMRHIYRVDIASVKELAVGLVSLKPVVPQGIGPLFYVHIFLVSSLLAYFPFSKLMHFGGIFLSPTRNLANNNRMRRHVNPWDYPVNVHTYQEWQEEFKDKLEMAGIPLDEELTKPQDALV